MCVIHINMLYPFCVCLALPLIQHIHIINPKAPTTTATTSDPTLATRGAAPLYVAIGDVTLLLLHDDQFEPEPEPEADPEPELEPEPEPELVP